MMRVPACFIIVCLLNGFSLADPATNKNLGGKKNIGGQGGFYSSRFGSVYNAKDFEPDVPVTTVASLQLPHGVAGSHQQNSDDDIKSEVPNVEEYTAVPPTPVSEDIHLDIKGGVKGGVKGVKGSRPRSGAFTEAPFLARFPTTFIPETTFSVIRLTVQPNGLPVTTVAPENLVRKNTKKGVKGGRKGYQYDTKHIKNRFADDLVTTAPADVTTEDVYSPQILNLPTERRVESYTTTENYRQETEAPIQQTELPIQQTEIPEQQTELPVQDTESPVQQTQEPVRETEPTTYRPTTYRPTTYEPVQDTQSPEDPQVTQKPELPYQTTFVPTTTESYNDQQTEIPQVTQLPEEPIQTTVSDEFSRFPLGVEGRHLLKGAQGGKTKGKGGSKTVKVPKRHKSTPTVRLPDDLHLNSRRLPKDPSTPLLPSLTSRN